MSAALAQVLLSASRKHYTACGTGTMVWHCWGDGRPLVLLHGGSGSWTHWVRNIAALTATGRQVWVPDLPGFGDSALPTGCGDADTVAECLNTGLREVLGMGPHEIVAFSFGSLAAVLLATQHPVLVARLLLVGLPVLPLAHGRGAVFKPWRKAATAQARVAAHRANLANLMLHDPSRIDDDTLALHAANAARDRMPDRRLATSAACANAVRHLGCTFHCIYGAQDVLYRDLWPQVREACEVNPHCAGFAFIPDAGHWVQYEQAEAFNRMSRTWSAATNA